MIKKIAVKLMILVFTFVILFCQAQAEAQEGILPFHDTNLGYPVLIELEKSNASGFFLKTPSDLYFVTAKHGLFTEKGILKSNNATLYSYRPDLKVEAPIIHELNLKGLNEIGCITSHSAYDVVVIKIGRRKDGKLFLDQYIKLISKPSEDLVPIAVDHTAVRLFEDVQLANVVFIFGFPTSLSRTHPLVSPDILSHLDYRKPLLRKGIIAGKNSKIKTIILDCPSYGGNSGGPVIEVVYSDGHTYSLVIGVISRFVPFIETWTSDKHPFYHAEIRNSGYSIIMPMDAVLELVEMK